MHPNSSRQMEWFFVDKVRKLYDLNDPVRILDVGSRVAHRRHRSYKDMLLNRGLLVGNWTYTGIDIIPGLNVDVVVKPYRFSPPLGSQFEVVISGQTLEHVANPFMWINAINRVLKPGGLVCIIAPSAGPHHWDYDYWRVFPEAMRALFDYVGFKTISTSVYENEPWRDCVGIAQKRGTAAEPVKENL